MRADRQFRYPSTRVPERTPAPALSDFPFRTIEKLRFADTDRNGHVTNSVFAVCCQNARMELLCDLVRVPLPPCTQFVIAKLLLEFRAEMHWPGTVEVGTRVERVGRSSVTLVQGLFMNERCVAIAESIVVLMDKTSRLSTPLPDEAAQVLGKFSRASMSILPRPANFANGEATRNE